MKKFFVAVIICFSIFCLFGCERKVDISTQFSEITYEYYSGQSVCGKVVANISVGEREDPYIIDGKHETTCEFSLLVVSFDFWLEENNITIEFFKNQSMQSVMLEFNPLNSTYMTDLGFALDNESEYYMVYKNYTLSFSMISKDFKVDFEDAIMLSLSELGDKVQAYYQGKNFEGECYLKILRRVEEEVKFYWIFTIIGIDGKSNNVLIDIDKREIILSN